MLRVEGRAGGRGSAVRGRRGGGRRTLHLLLASSSVAALLIGGRSSALAADLPVKPCGANGFVGMSLPGIANTAAISCIFISNSTISGAVTNSASGAIGLAPLSTAVTITNSTIGGAVSNAGQISAASAAIRVFDNAVIAGGITNSGTIAAGRGIIIGRQRTGSGSYIIPRFSGGIDNSGQISTTLGAGIVVGGGATGGVSITVSTFTGGITNSGTISAAHSGILVGGTGTRDGTITVSTFIGGITNSGTISGAEGVSVVATTRAGGGGAAISNFAGGIGNSGTISASGHGIFVGGRVATASAPSQAGSAVISAFSGGVGNTGTITSANGSGIYVGGRATGANSSVTFSTFAGGVSNSGTISAAYAGLFVGGTALSKGAVTLSSFAGGVSNSGAISVAHSGFYVGGTAVGGSVTLSTFAGGVSNSGTVSAALFGIFVGGRAGPGSSASQVGTVVISAFTGGIRNGGTISSSNGGDIYVGGRATGSGTSVTLSTFSGGISNSGTISTPLSGIYVGGTAANHGAVTLASFVGGISNAGAISAVGSGIFVGGSAASGASLTLSTFAGGISNSGTISAAYGILVAGYSKNSGVTTISVFSGGITNSGTIATSKTGLAVRNVATFMGGISNSGVISEAVSNASGIALTVYDVSTFSGGIVNSGTVSSNRYGIQSENVSTFLGGITNSGVISLNSTRVGIGVYNISTLSGGIVNSGTISGGLFPIVVENVSSFTGGVTNSGLIDGWVPGIGIDVVGAGTFAGGILNSGTIASAKSGITVANVSAFGGGITNSGSIGVGSGQIANPQPGTGLYVKNVSTFTGTVLNSGTISPSGAGVLLQNISTFNGGITNSGLISLGYRGLGIDVESPSVLTGSIVNSGTIVGASTSGYGGFGVVTLAPAIGLQLNGVAVLSGGITNSGSISVAGAGIFVENSGTIIGSVLNSGTIAAGAASGTPHTAIAISGVSAISGGITNTGAITAGIGIAVSNSGPVSVFDSGTIVSTGVSSFGVISIGGVSTFSGGITNAGTVNGNAATLTEGGSGITIVGVSTFSGGITKGVIITTPGGVISGSLTFSGGGITNAGGITNVGSVTNGVAVDLSQNSPGNKFTLGPGYSISGAVLGSGSDTFQLGGSGSGTFDVSTIGTNQQYQGFTTFNVVSGGWTLSGTFGQTQSWNVLGGTLAGNAALGSVNVASGGVLAPGLPGTPGGRLTVSGNLAFASGAIYLVQINPATASYTSVAGSAALNGNVLAAFAAGNYLMKQYTILTSSGLNGSKFAGLGTTNLPAGFDASLSYSATDAFLNLTAALGRPASGSSLGGNQQNIANSLNNFFNGGGALTPNFVTIFGMTGGNLTTALSQLSGQARTAGEQGSFKMMSNFLGLAVDPSVAGRGGDAAGGGAIGFAPEEDPSTPAGIPIELTPVINPAQPPSFDQRWTAWGSGFGGYNKTNGDPSAGTSTVTTSVYGFAGGMDYHATPDLMVGFALAGSGSNWALAQNLGSGRSDLLQTGVYGTAHAGPAYLSASLAFTNHWITTNRTAALGDQLTAAFDAQSYGARLEAGYRLAPSPLIGVTPYAAAQTQVFRTPGYSETDLTGGGFGLSYNAMTATDTRSEVGARFDDLTTVNGMPLILRARTAWAHDWVSTPALTATFQTLPGANFVVNGTAIPANSALATVSAELRLTTAWSFGAQFDGEVASGSQTYAGTGTLRYTW